MTYLEEYRELIKTGQVIVGEYLEREIDNLVEDLSNPAYIYDTTEAHKRIAFQERFCTQGKNPYYGKPIKLMPWQCAWWEAVYSFRMADNGFRRFIEGLMLIARKNGKSTSFAADGVTDLLVGAGGSDIAVGSNDDKQAKLIWDEAAGMRERLDVHNRITAKNITMLRNKTRNIKMFRLSSKMRSLDGYNITKFYLDESHDLKTNELPEAAWRGMSSQDEPLFLNCTTQGFVIDGYLDNKIRYARDVIDGIRDDPRFIAFLFEQDSEAEVWQDESSWEKSNPSLRYGVKKIDKLRRDVEIAKTQKAERLHLLVKDFNIKIGTSQGWLSESDYSYEQEITDLEQWRGCFCLAAVDLAETTDLSNCKLLFMREGDKTKYIYSHYWLPESKLTDSDDKAAGAKYKEWAADEHITITEGTMTDNTLIADWLAELKARYNIRVLVCGYDQRFSAEFLHRMDDYGIKTELIQQTAAVMSTPMKWVEADFKNRVINYGNQPVDKWCLSNACIQVDNLARCMCVKPKGQHSKRIDGAVTLIILYAVLMRYQSEYTKYL